MLCLYLWVFLWFCVRVAWKAGCMNEGEKHSRQWGVMCSYTLPYPCMEAALWREDVLLSLSQAFVFSSCCEPLLSCVPTLHWLWQHKAGRWPPHSCQLQHYMEIIGFPNKGFSRFLCKHAGKYFSLCDSLFCCYRFWPAWLPFLIFVYSMEDTSFLVVVWLLACQSVVLVHSALPGACQYECNWRMWFPICAQQLVLWSLVPCGVR